MIAPVEPSEFMHVHHMPLVSECSHECGFCEVLGCLHSEERTLEGLEQSFQKARFYRADAISLPENCLRYQHLDKIIEMAEADGMPLVIQVRGDHLTEKKMASLAPYVQQGLGIEVVAVRHISEEDWGRILMLRRAAGFFQLTLIPNRTFDLFQFLQSMPVSLAKTLRLRAPQFANAKYYGCDELFFLLEDLRETFPNIPLQADPRFEPWNFRLDLQVERSPLLPCQFSTHPEGGEVPQTSVLVLDRSSKESMLHTLRSLKEQKCDSQQFEILLLTREGSECLHAEFFREVAFLLRDTRVQIFALPTFGLEKRGDTGVLKNFGAYRARGRFLVFLDAGVVLPDDFVGAHVRLHDSADLLQWPVLELASTEVGRTTCYENIQQVFASTPLKGEQKKLSEVQRWDFLSNHWQHVSFTALSIKKEVFLEAKGFSRSFDRPGFEDAFLGFKVSRTAARWKFRSEKLYQVLDGSSSTSVKSQGISQMAEFSRSAKVVYLTSLSRDVYRFLFPMLGRFVWPRLLLSRMKDFGLDPIFIPVLWMFETLKNASLDPFFINQFIKQWIVHFLKWRIIEPIKGQTWRIHVLRVRTTNYFFRLKSQLWKLKVPLWRLKEFSKSVYWNYIFPTFEKARENVWFFSDPMAWLRIKAPKAALILERLQFPFWKIYYFLDFQIQKRVMGSNKEKRL